jgi:hypothetical protein
VESVELRMKAHLERQVLHENVRAAQWHCLLMLMESGVMVYLLLMFISLALSLSLSVCFSLSHPLCTVLYVLSGHGPSVPRPRFRAEDCS